MRLLDILYRDEHGASALQYALIAGVLSIAVLAGSLALRGEIIALYEGMGQQANQALSADD